MRFGIRDILLLTTIVAVYTAGTVVVWQAGKLDLSTRIRGIWVQVAMAAWFAYQSYQMAQRMGVTTTKVRFRGRPYSHLAGLLGYWVFVGFSLYFGDEFYFWPILTLCLVGHIAVEASTQILIGETGVSWGSTLLAWDQYEFEVLRNRIVATPITPGEGRRVRRFPLEPDDVNTVRAILAAKQEKEQTTDHTDGHG